jgi:hypothetical protein
MDMVFSLHGRVGRDAGIVKGSNADAAVRLAPRVRTRKTFPRG